MIENSPIAIKLLCRACLNAPEEAVYQASEILANIETFDNVEFFVGMAKGGTESPWSS